jgi:hypothetical protein
MRLETHYPRLAVGSGICASHFEPPISLELLVRVIELCALLPPQLSPVSISTAHSTMTTLEPDSLLLLRHVLDHRLDAVLLLKLADEARVPATRQVTTRRVRFDEKTTAWGLLVMMG